MSLVRPARGKQRSVAAVVLQHVEPDGGDARDEHHRQRCEPVVAADEQDRERQAGSIDGERDGDLDRGDAVVARGIGASPFPERHLSRCPLLSSGEP